MGVEKVVLCGFGEQGVNIGASLLTVPQPGVEVDKPSPAPAGVRTLTGNGILVVLAPALDCTLRGGE